MSFFLVLLLFPYFTYSANISDKENNPFEQRSKHLPSDYIVSTFNGTFKRNNSSLSNNKIKSYLEVTHRNKAIVERDVLELDNEWNLHMNHSIDPIPALIIDVFNAIGNNKFELAKRSDVIRFFFEKGKEDGEILSFHITNPQHNDQIVEAELIIPSVLLTTGKVGLHRDIIVRLYQLVPNQDDYVNTTIDPDQHQLLAVSYVSSINTDNQIFKVKQTLGKWSNQTLTVNYFITVSDLNDNWVILKINKNQLLLQKILLAVYMKSTQGDGYSSDILHKQFPTSASNYNRKLCSTRPFYVDFEEIGWSNFILMPPGFMANICSGTCDSLMYSNYIKLLYGLNVLKQVNCVPTKFDPLAIMFYDKSYNIVIKKYKDIVLRSCSCL